MIRQPNKKYSRVIGVDVAKHKLDVVDSTGKLNGVVENTASSIAKQICRRIRNKACTLVLCEGTGGYESALVDSMHEQGIDVAVVNPRQVRDFAKGHGKLEKTDSIDAAMICKFGQDVEVHPVEKPSPLVKTLRALFTRRCQVVKQLVRERNQLEKTRVPDVVSLIKMSIDSQKRELKLLDQKIQEIVKELSQDDPRIDNWLSVKGVGTITVAMLLSEMREIGNLSRGAIAKLVGVAPMARDSGTQSNPRTVRGGRVKARNVLYLAALTAGNYNPVFQAFKKRLLKKGKAKKLVIIAMARKLLVLLNDMSRRDEKWDPEYAEKKQLPAKAAAACSTTH